MIANEFIKINKFEFRIGTFQLGNSCSLYFESVTMRKYSYFFASLKTFTQRDLLKPA